MQPARGPAGGRTVPVAGAARNLFARKRTGTDEEAICGEFQRIVDWKLQGVRGRGLIIQKVKKTFLIKNVGTGNNMSSAEIDTYVATSGGETRLNGWLTYWEAWIVPNGQDEPDSGDSFSLASVVDQLGSGQDTTKGWFKMVGEANFYKTTRAASYFGFSAGAVTNPANGLPWSRTAPTNLPAPRGRPVIHTVKVKWDSTQEDPLNRGEYGPTKVVVDTIA